VHYHEKVIELSSGSLKLEISARLNTSMVKLCNQIDYYYGLYVLDRFLKSLTNCMRDDLIVIWVQSSRDLLLDDYSGDPLILQETINDMRTYVNLDIPIAKYGEKAIVKCKTLLYRMGSNSYTKDWWIGMVDFHSDLYWCLQDHYFRRLQCFTLLEYLGEDCQEQKETKQ